MTARAQVAVPARSTPPPSSVTGVTGSSGSPKSFRDFVTEMGARRGLKSDAAIARAAGVDAGAVSRWLAGHNGATIQSLRKLGDALGVELRDMIVASGQAEPEELGMTPALPLPEEVAAILAILDDNSYTQREHEALLIGVDQIIRGWSQRVEVHRNRPKEPKMRERRAPR